MIIGIPSLTNRCDVLKLTVRTQSCLRNEDIVYIGELVQHGEWQMLRIPNFGRVCLRQLKAELANIGLHFGMELPNWPPRDLGGSP